MKINHRCLYFGDFFVYNCVSHYKIDMNDLTITQRKESTLGFNMYSSNPFFKNKKEVVISFDEWGVYFRTPSIDDENTINRTA